MWAACAVLIWSCSRCRRSSLAIWSAWSLNESYTRAASSLSESLSSWPRITIITLRGKVWRIGCLRAFPSPHASQSILPRFNSSTNFSAVALSIPCVVLMVSISRWDILWFHNICIKSALTSLGSSLIARFTVFEVPKVTLSPKRIVKSSARYSGTLGLFVELPVSSLGGKAYAFPGSVMPKSKVHPRLKRVPIDTRGCDIPGSSSTFSSLMLREGSTWFISVWCVNWTVPFPVVKLRFPSKAISGLPTFVTLSTCLARWMEAPLSRIMSEYGTLCIAKCIFLIMLCSSVMLATISLSLCVSKRKGAVRLGMSMNWKSTASDNWTHPTSASVLALSSLSSCKYLLTSALAMSSRR